MKLPAREHTNLQMVPDWASTFPLGNTRNGIWPNGGLPAEINVMITVRERSQSVFLFLFSLEFRRQMMAVFANTHSAPLFLVTLKITTSHRPWKYQTWLQYIFLDVHFHSGVSKDGQGDKSDKPQEIANDWRSAKYVLRGLRQIKRNKVWNKMEQTPGSGLCSLFHFELSASHYVCTKLYIVSDKMMWWNWLRSLLSQY